MDSPEISRMTTHIKHDIASATSFGFQDYLRPFMRRPLVHAKLGGAAERICEARNALGGQLDRLDFAKRLGDTFLP